MTLSRAGIFHKFMGYFRIFGFYFLNKSDMTTGNYEGIAQWLR